jgi:hypothetical protein
MNEKLDLAIESYIKRRYLDDAIQSYSNLYNAVKESGQTMDKVSMFTPAISYTRNRIDELMYKIRTDIKMYFDIHQSDVLNKYVGDFLREVESEVIG